MGEPHASKLAKKTQIKQKIYHTKLDHTMSNRTDQTENISHGSTIDACAHTDRETQSLTHSSACCQLKVRWKREGGAGCRVLNRSICWLGGDDVGREQAAEAEPVPLRHREPRALQRSHATRISTLPRCRERRTQGRNTRVEPWVVEDVGAALEEHHGAVALRRDEPVRQQEEVVVVIPAAATARWPQPRPRERERKPRRGRQWGAGDVGEGEGERKVQESAPAAAVPLCILHAATDAGVASGEGGGSRRGERRWWPVPAPPERAAAGSRRARARPSIPPLPRRACPSSWPFPTSPKRAAAGSRRGRAPAVEPAAAAPLPPAAVAAPASTGPSRARSAAPTLAVVSEKERRGESERVETERRGEERRGVDKVGENFEVGKRFEFEFQIMTTSNNIYKY
uniref:Uncharacterized protein n=1 Tax=Oryza sativa subsp. japonica TaxID=39947 RepID=Q5Z6V5_ORYSJ|nr:hypothetical protein [Oryza sativa Japonica Group]